MKYNNLAEGLKCNKLNSKGFLASSVSVASLLLYTTLPHYIINKANLTELIERNFNSGLPLFAFFTSEQLKRYNLLSRRSPLQPVSFGLYL